MYVPKISRLSIISKIYGTLLSRYDSHFIAFTHHNILLYHCVNILKYYYIDISCISVIVARLYAILL